MDSFFIAIFLISVVKASLIDWDNMDRIDFNERSIGGNEVVPHSNPFQAYLIITTYTGETENCGGSLISTRAVLTAAHCLEFAENVEVILGAHNIQEEEYSQVRLISKKFIIYPYWLKLISYNDIAIIKLPESVKLNEYIDIIEIPRSEESYVNYIGIASGWGAITESTSDRHPVLKRNLAKIISDSECSRSYPFIMNMFQICSEGGKSACQGDSGGPLTTEINNKIRLIGVTSFVHQDGCDKGHPTVYTRLTNYADWIAANSGITNYVAVIQRLSIILSFFIFLFLFNFVVCCI